MATLKRTPAEVKRDNAAVMGRAGKEGLYSHGPQVVNVFVGRDQEATDAKMAMFKAMTLAELAAHCDALRAAAITGADSYADPRAIDTTCG